MAIILFTKKLSEVRKKMQDSYVRETNGAWSIMKQTKKIMFMIHVDVTHRTLIISRYQCKEIEDTFDEYARFNSIMLSDILPMLREVVTAILITPNPIDAEMVIHKK